jgi:hypothetical protein
MTRRIGRSAASRIFLWLAGAALVLALATAGLLVLEAQRTARAEAERVTQAVSATLADRRRSPRLSRTAKTSPPARRCSRWRRRSCRTRCRLRHDHGCRRHPRDAPRPGADRKALHRHHPEHADSPHRRVQRDPRTVAAHDRAGGGGRTPRRLGLGRRDDPNGHRASGAAAARGRRRRPRARRRRARRRGARPPRDALGRRRPPRRRHPRHPGIRRVDAHARRGPARTDARARQSHARCRRTHRTGTHG